MTERLKKSEAMLQKLEYEMVETIKKVEKENDYQFMSYEIDYLLLKKMIETHSGYLRRNFK